MKFNKTILIVFSALICSTMPSFALIQVDDNSIELAIQYGLKMKDLSTRDLLGNNWINDNTGKILTIYSPFIQLVSKSTAQTFTGNTKEDVKNIKTKLTSEIKRITTKNEVRFILDVQGDSVDFAKDYNSYIIDVNEYSSDSREKSIIKPKKQLNQKIADKDNFDPKHPFSAINLYSYKFNDLCKLKEYYLVIVSENGKETKFKIDNSQIF